MNLEQEKLRERVAALEVKARVTYPPACTENWVRWVAQTLEVHKVKLALLGQPAPDAQTGTSTKEPAPQAGEPTAMCPNCGTLVRGFGPAPLSAAQVEEVVRDFRNYATALSPETFIRSSVVDDYLSHRARRKLDGIEARAEHAAQRQPAEVDRARRGEQKTETPPVAERVRGAPIITPAGETPCPCRNHNCTSFHVDRPEYYYRPPRLRGGGP